MARPNKGFLVIAQNSTECDYIKQAYHLALSIKRTQPLINNVSLLTNDTVPSEYASAFDKIIPFTAYDLDAGSTWKVRNRWWAYHLTPYHSTVLLDSDMLVLSDLTTMWEKLNGKPLHFTSEVKDFKGNKVTSTFYRKCFVENDLPNLYTGVCYFEKTDQSLEFWKLVEYITYNWERFYYEFSPKSTQKFYSLDVTVSIAAKILGIENVTDKLLTTTFTHMKSQLQGWSNTHPDWTKVAQINFINKDKIFINQYKQEGILHYVENDFLEGYINDVS
jgi:hypothetical protein